MAKQELGALDTFQSLVDADLIFGHSAAANKYGFFKASQLKNKGYAVRRWKLSDGNPTGEAVGNLDYLKAFPSLIGLGCYLVDDNHNRRKLDPTNHYKLATGEAAVLDGSQGQYQWGWGTKIYFATWIEDGYFYLAASTTPVLGRYNYIIPVGSTSAVGCGIMDRTNDKLCSLISTAEQYRGGNGSALDAAVATYATGQQLTQLGMGATNIPISTFELKAANRGIGWHAGWWMHETITSILFQIIFGTRDVQAAYNSAKDANGLYQGGLGPGITTFPNWDKYSYYGVCPVNIGVNLADACGVVTYDVPKADGTINQTISVPVFFGLKNPFGQFIRGINGQIGVKQADTSYKWYVSKTSRGTWNYSDTANMLYVGASPIGTDAWDYIKSVNLSGLSNMPTECGATAATFYCDGAYLDKATSGYRAPVVSGDAYSGALDGLAYLYGNCAPGDAYACLSAPLCEVAEEFNPEPTLIE